MMRIRNYKKFLSENYNPEDYVDGTDHDGYTPAERLEEDIMALYLKKSNRWSFSYLAGSESASPDADFHYFLDGLIKMGWTEQAIKDNIKEAYERHLDNKCGSIDLFMYRMSGEKDVLGGDIFYSDDSDETLVRFNYGWHKTAYGKLFIEAKYGDNDKFLQEALDSLIKKAKEEGLECSARLDGDKIIVSGIGPDDEDDFIEMVHDRFGNVEKRGSDLVLGK